MSSPDWLKRLDYGFLLPFAGKLPFSLAQNMADFRGWIRFHSDQDSRNHALRNVTSKFPGLQRHEVEKTVLSHYQTPSRDEVEAFWYAQPLDRLRRFTRVSGLQLLKEAADSGSGVILFSGHLGSTGLFFSFIGKSGIPMNIVGRSIEPEENPLHPAEWSFNQKRVRWIEEAVRTPFLLTGRGNYSKMLTKLRSGEVVMLLIDVVPTLARRHVPVHFLGSRARIADGIASLFRESNARLVHFMIRWIRESRTHEIELIEMTNSVSRSSPNEVIMQTLIDQVEGKIRLYPDHWWCWDSLTHFYSERSD